MHRFAQYTKILKKFQNSVIHTSRNHNDEIVEILLHAFFKLSLLYDASIQKIIFYKIEAEFLFELSWFH